MASKNVSRRSVLKVAGIMGGWSEAALSFEPTRPIQHEVAAVPPQEDAPKHSIRFAVIGLDHSHINSIVEIIRHGGGELVAVHSTDRQAVAAFQKRFGARVATSEDEILNDSSIQLVCSAAIPNRRGPLGVQVMRHGKDFLVDKPALTTLEQLADVRRTIQDASIRGRPCMPGRW